MEAVAAVAALAAVEAAGCLVAAGAGCLAAAVGASPEVRQSPAPDRLSGPRGPAERASALRLFRPGLRVVSADREPVPAPVALQLFPPVLVWAIAPKSADSLASAIDRV